MADEWRPSKLLYNWEWLEYWEESWRLEKTCCHSNSSERPSAYADKKNSDNESRLCGDWEEIVYHIISECRKLAQEDYKVVSTGWADDPLGDVQGI